MSPTLVASYGRIVCETVDSTNQLKGIRHYFNNIYVENMAKGLNSSETRIAGALCWAIMALEYASKNDAANAYECRQIAKKHMELV